jgi:hypothetical protein
MEASSTPLSKGWVAALFACGCASQSVAFRPIVTTGTVGATHSATNYTLHTGDANEVLGEAAVWSEGARAGGSGPRVDVRMRIHNRTGAPMELVLANTHLQLTSTRARTLTVTAPDHVSGTLRVDAGTTSGFAVSYPIPKPLEPGDVAEFELSWQLRTNKGVVNESTPFVPTVSIEDGTAPSICMSSYPNQYSAACPGGNWWYGYGYYDGPSDPALPPTFGGGP